MLGVNSVVTVVCKQLHPQRSGGSAAIAESHKVPCPLVTLKGCLSLRVGNKVIIAPAWNVPQMQRKYIFNTITCTLLHGQLQRVETCTTHSNNIMQVNQLI